MSVFTANASFFAFMKADKMQTGMNKITVISKKVFLNNKGKIGKSKKSRRYLFTNRDETYHDWTSEEKTVIDCTVAKRKCSKMVLKKWNKNVKEQKFPNFDANITGKCNTCYRKEPS